MNSANNRALWYMLLALALLAYVLPWLHNPPTGLTFAAYDLAEWSSLHPLARAATPPLLTSLLLRIPLPCLLLGLLFVVNNPPKWFLIFSVSVTSIALLPPFEFLTQFRDDPNYQQQFAISILTFLIGILAASQLARSLHKISALAFFALSIISAIAGTIDAARLMTAFGLPASIGLGIILHCAIALLATALTVPSPWKNKTEQLHHAATPSNASR
ncbi:MAG: hypothetical protein JNJ61_14760 [Anaerolineae bacterium]|nr:hypothetical protein [Anaerolineae bacterium]